MIINKKCYCDVCLQEIEDKPEVRFMFPGGDNINNIQERHYCNEHRMWYNLWEDLRHGEDIGKLAFQNKAKENEKENKEVSVSELYDILSELCKKHYNYLADITIPDKDLRDYYKQVLEADITYNRMKTQGKITEKENKEC